MLRIILLTGLAIILCACSENKQQETPELRTEYTAVHYYQCDKSFAFTAAYTKDSVRILLPDGEVTLPNIISASGAKYKKDKTLLWNKGNQVVLEYKNHSYTGCTNNSIEATWQKAKLEGVDFRAIGQEPGWILEIKNESKIQFAYNYGQDTVYVPVPNPASEDSLSFTSETETHKLQVDITEKPCTDSMNGAEFPLSVVVRLDGEEYRGCGRFL